MDDCLEKRFSNFPPSKRILLLKMVGHPRRSDLARHITSFTLPTRRIDNSITNEAVNKLLEYYGQNAEYRHFLQQRGINPIVFCKIVFFMKKNCFFYEKNCFFLKEIKRSFNLKKPA